MDINKIYNELTNVNGFTIDGAYLYEMPVALSEVKVGDIISTRGSTPYTVVKEVTESGSFKCVMPTNGVVSEILPEKNMFGFNFVTKVFNPFGNMVKPSKSNPFGDMNSLMPLMLMDKDSDNNDFFKIYMMMNMMQGNNENFNPMMMMLAMRD